MHIYRFYAGDVIQSFFHEKKERYHYIFERDFDLLHKVNTIYIVMNLKHRGLETISKHCWDKSHQAKTMINYH